MESMPYREILSRVIGGHDLTVDQTRDAFNQIMDGQWSEAQIAGLLTALAAKGETIDEIAGAAMAMREHVVPVKTSGADVIDIVGTGGTGLRTFNISTATTLVVAGAGVKVAKHGNRTNTRASGSADGLRALGVNIDADPATLTDCLTEAGACFCYAVTHHPAMRYAGPPRKQLGVRTVFNILGPLTNPAGAKRQITGVFNNELTEVLAYALGQLGSDRAMIVHSQDGLDEISLGAPTRLSEWRNGQVKTRSISPADFGMSQAPIEALLIDSPEASARTIRGILAGTSGPQMDIVLLNAGAALHLADKAPSIEAGIAVARESIDSGAAMEVLTTLVEVTNS